VTLSNSDDDGDTGGWWRWGQHPRVYFILNEIIKSINTKQRPRINRKINRKQEETPTPSKTKTSSRVAIVTNEEGNHHHVDFGNRHNNNVTIITLRDMNTF
jgi:hypothetical protein